MIFQGFTGTDFSAYNDDEPIWTDGEQYAIGEKPAGFDRQWSTAGKARENQEINSRPLPTYTEWMNAEIKLNGGDLSKARF